MDARQKNQFVAALLLIGGGWLAGCGSGGPKDWADHTQGLPFVMGYDEGMKAAAAENKPVMMFVTTTWCGWCKKLAAENFNEPEVKELLTKFVCVIVDGDVETAAAKKLGANGYPHIVFLSAKGEKLAEQPGYASVDEFKPLVQAALKKADAGG
jgi:thioredoxin-related protein